METGSSEHRVSVLPDEKPLGMNGGDSSTAMGMSLEPLGWALKTGNILLAQFCNNYK